MPKYLFIHEQQDNSFPERYLVVSAGENAELLCKKENLTGTVLDVETIDTLEKMIARCESNESLRVELIDAPSWKFIEMRFNPEEAEANAAQGPGSGGIVS